MQALANITTLTEVRAYAAAEAAEASKKCPGAYGDYKLAVDQASAYMTFAGTALEISYVEMVRQMIESARNTWYSVGCAPPNDTGQSTPSQPGTPSPGNGGNKPPLVVPANAMSKYILLVGALGAAIWYLGKNKSKIKSTAKRAGRKVKRVARRVTRRRRRR